MALDKRKKKDINNAGLAMWKYMQIVIIDLTAAYKFNLLML